MTELVDVVNSREHQRIILIPSQSSADFFLEHIYAHNYSFVIVTADQSYPKDKKVRDLLWEKIDNDFKTTIIILGRLDKDLARLVLPLPLPLPFEPDNEEKGGVEYNWKAILSQNLDPDFFYECTKEEAEINRIKTKV